MARPSPESAVLPRARLVGAVEALEDVRQGLRRDADPVVGDGDADLRVVHRKGRLDAAARGACSGPRSRAGSAASGAGGPRRRGRGGRRRRGTPARSPGRRPAPGPSGNTPPAGRSGRTPGCAGSRCRRRRRARFSRVVHQPGQAFRSSWMTASVSRYSAAGAVLGERHVGFPAGSPRAGSAFRGRRRR